MKAHYGMLKSARNAALRKKVADQLRMMRSSDAIQGYKHLTRKTLNAENRRTAQAIANIYRNG